jgi:hypothetical protein
VDGVKGPGIATIYNFHVEADLDGDYNFDGIVDTADYIVWRKTGGTQQGYIDWRSNFGMSVGSGAGSSSHAALPEPTCVLLLTLGAALGAVRGRRVAWRVPRSR